MVKIKNVHRLLKNEPLKSRAEFHYEKMNGIALYAPYQPLVTALGLLFSPFGTALANFKLRGTDRTDAKNKIQTDIMDFLNSISRKLEDAANEKGVSQADGEALVKGAGFDLAETRTTSTKKPLTFLEVPRGVKATDEQKQGFVFVEWNTVIGALTYLIQSLDAEGRWVIVGVSEETSVVLSGFPSKMNQTFCITAIGSGTLMSDSSDTVTVHVS